MQQTIGETLAETASRRPVLAAVLDAFGPVLTRRAEVATLLADQLGASGFVVPSANFLRMQQGISLLAGCDFAGAAPLVVTAAHEMLPVLGGLEALSSHTAQLAGFFDSAADMARLERLVAAVVNGEHESVAELAGGAGIDPLVLEFAAGFVVSAVLRAVAAKAAGEQPADGAGDGTPIAAWKRNEVWQQGYCPVCGALPMISWLDKPVNDAKNAYLVGGGGKRHLYCGVCGADWLFQRGACPACGKKGSDVIEILHESGPHQGERIDWCTSCKGYCPCVDLREREFVPNWDAMALGMMHLDMVAAQKKLRPVRPAFWNMF